MGLSPAWAASALTRCACLGKLMPLRPAVSNVSACGAKPSGRCIAASVKHSHEMKLNIWVAARQVDAEAMGAWMSSLDAMRAKQQAEVDAAAAARGGTAAAPHAANAAMTNGAAAVTPAPAATVTA